MFNDFDGLMTFKEFVKFELAESWLGQRLNEEEVYVSDGGDDTTEREAEKHANKIRNRRIARMKQDARMRRKMYDVKQLAWDIKSIARAKAMLASELDIDFNNGKTEKV